MRLFSDYAVDFRQGVNFLAWHVVRRDNGRIFDGPYGNEATALDRLNTMRIIESLTRGDLVFQTPTLVEETIHAGE